MSQAISAQQIRQAKSKAREHERRKCSHPAKKGSFVAIQGSGG